MKKDVINDHANSGLNMIDINSFRKGLKTTWVRKYIDDKNHRKWKLFFDLELWTTVVKPFWREPL